MCCWQIARESPPETSCREEITKHLSWSWKRCSVGSQAPINSFKLSKRKRSPRRITRRRRTGEIGKLARRDSTPDVLTASVAEPKLWGMVPTSKTQKTIARCFALAQLCFLCADSAAAQNANSRAQQAAFDQNRVFAQQSFSQRNAAVFTRNIVAPTLTRVEQSWYRQPSYSRPYAPSASRESPGTPRTYGSRSFTVRKSGLALSEEILASVGELGPTERAQRDPAASAPAISSRIRKEQLQVVEAWKYFLGEGRTRDAQKAVALSREAAQSGDPDAALLLGVAYLKGDAVEQNDKKAFEWMSRAAAKNNRVAQSLLGEFYFAGIGVQLNEEQAMRLFAKSADEGQAYAQLRVSQGFMQGYGGAAPDFVKALRYAVMAEQTLPRAGFEVGFILLTGRAGVTADPPRAAGALQRAAKSGHALSQYLYATCLQAGVGVPKDLTAAIPWLQMAADQELPMARLRLGEVYAFGLGTPPDRARAMQWFEKAAKDAEPGALNAIGILYSEDGSTLNNIERAAEYFKRAAAQGDPAGKLNLGAAYLLGRGVPRDDSLALRWLTESADQGKALAQYLLGLLQLGAGDIPINDSEAIRRFRQAVLQGNPAAMGMLCELSMLGRGGLRMDNADLTKPMQDGISENEAACLYVAAIRLERGLLGPQDSRKGLELLRQSAELGYHYAELNLGQLYLLGRYVPLDAMEGRRWLERAAAHGNLNAQQLLHQAGLR